MRILPVRSGWLKSVRLVFCMIFQCLAVQPTHGQQHVTLLFAGDAMLHKQQIDCGRQSDGTYDFTSCFSQVADEVSSADLAVVNMETTLGGLPYSGYPLFCAPDAYGAALRDAGFDVFLTANNHALDRGARGVRRTLRALDSLCVAHVGTFYDERQKMSYHPLMISCKGVRIAFLNYTYGTNGIILPPPSQINYLDLEKIKNDVIKARHLGGDVIVACVHWGNEYTTTPTREQELLGQQLLDQGVHLVIGSHPHVVQPMVLMCDAAGMKTGLVAYSLGNFISNMKIRNTTGGAILKVRMRKDGHQVCIDSVAYALVVTRRPIDTAHPGFVLFPASRSYSDAHLPLSTQQIINTYLNDVRTLLRKQNRGVEEYKF